MMDDREKVKDLFRSFIDKRVEQLMLKPFIGKVISKTDEDLEIQIFGIQGSPTFKWSTGLFYRLDNFWLNEGDDVLIETIGNAFAITGRITKSFPKFKELKSIGTSPTTILEELKDNDIVGFELWGTTIINKDNDSDPESVHKSISWQGRFGDIPSTGIRITFETTEDHREEDNFSLISTAPKEATSDDRVASGGSPPSGQALTGESHSATTDHETITHGDTEEEDHSHGGDTSGPGRHLHTIGDNHNHEHSISDEHTHSMEEHTHLYKEDFNKKHLAVIITVSGSELQLSADAVITGAMARPFKDSYY